MENDIINILILEDNRDDFDLMRREIIKRWPECKIAHAQTIKTAGELMNPGILYDLAIFDIQLPDGNGLDFLSALRKENVTMPVMILTGTGDEEIVLSALKAGADDYLVKTPGFCKRLPGNIEITLQSTSEKQKPVSVLYIEHNITDIDLTKRYLQKKAPYIRLTVIPDLEEALEILPRSEKDQSQFDIVMLDYRLPGLNALEIIKLLKQERRLSIAVVVVTGQGDELIAAEALKLGADNYLVKQENYLVKLPSVLISAFRRRELERQQVDLKDALEKAMESDRLKSVFLSTMSHELRTPLNTVIGFSDLIDEKTPLSKILEYSKYINDSGQHLLSIIESIFELSMMQAKQVRISSDQIELSQFMTELFVHTRILQENLNKQHLEYICSSHDTDYAGLTIVTDKTRLFLLLVNLLNNAFKFTVKGRIEFGCFVSKKLVSFQVADTGIGIESEKIESIFAKFRQSDDSHSREYGGVGLGLSICKEISDLLKGSLRVETKPGIGSKFIFDLPREIVEN